MLSDSWSCIMTQNGPGIVSDEIRLTLKAAACQLYAQKVERALIRSNHCGGIIQTEWKTATLGTRTGMVFKSQLEGDQGEYFVIRSS